MYVHVSFSGAIKLLFLYWFIIVATPVTVATNQLLFAWQLIFIWILLKKRLIIISGNFQLEILINGS